jgi:hypothetical protein
VRPLRLLTERRTKMKKAVAALVLALAIVPAAPAVAAGDPVETNVIERVECLFRVYVTEGGEQGLDCLT